MALIDLKIWNQGTPTYIVNWKAILVEKDGIRTEGQHFSISGHQYLENYGIVSPSISLATKTENTPVSTQPISGSLFFWFPVSPERLKKNDIKLEISAIDSHGTQFRHLEDLSKWIVW